MFYFSEFLSNFPSGARILVSPMEWGLGHATRCLPILNYLLNKLNANLLVAANGPQAALIKEAFPGIRIIEPPAYRIKYHKNRAATIATLVVSMPNLAKTIKAEHQWLMALAEKEPLDAIISDNRYGLWHPKIPSYLITHQLGIQTPFGYLADQLIRWKLYRSINRFKAVWVPDYPVRSDSLAGALSHPPLLPSIPVHYIGPLTRIQAVPPFQPLPNLPVTENLPPIAYQFLAGKAIDLLVILSGPEPQRTILENIILEQWKSIEGKSMLLVRGMPENHPAQPNDKPQQDTIIADPASDQYPNTWILPHLPAAAMSQAIANASAILCRSGYSSVMDLVPLQKNLWMIPTPGQSEQEYLAQYLEATGKIHRLEQNTFSLHHVFNHRSGATGRVPPVG